MGLNNNVMKPWKCKHGNRPLKSSLFLLCLRLQEWVSAHQLYQSGERETDVSKSGRRAVVTCDGVFEIECSPLISYSLLNIFI